MSNRPVPFTLLAGLLFALPPGSAKAEVTIYAYQNGSDVVTSGSGTIDTTDLNFVSGSGMGPPEVYGGAAFIRVGTGG